MTTEQDAFHFEHRHSRRKERQRFTGMWWAVVLIWAGLIFGAESLELLPQIGGADAGSWIFAGAGMASILGSIYRVLSPEYSDPTTWDWIWGAFCLIIGLGGFTDIEIFWPFILILAGLVLSASVLWGNDK